MYRRITRSMSMSMDSTDKVDTNSTGRTDTTGTVATDTEESGHSSSTHHQVSALAISVANPLLMEDYLGRLLPYFTTRQALTSIRSVCKTWSHASVPVIKNNLRWRVGPNKTSEEKFLKTMSKKSSIEERGRTFRNFNLDHGEPKLTTTGSIGSVLGRRVDKFMKEFGPYMVDLKIKSLNINYVREHLKQSFLSNLEQLEFYDMSESLLSDPTLFENTAPFPKVKSVCFQPDVRGWREAMEEEDETFNEGEGRICFNVLKACPNLNQIEINLRKTTPKLLSDVSSELNWNALTVFKNSLYDSTSKENSPSIVILDPSDFANLVKKCPNLKVLSVNFSNWPTKAEICQMLSRYAGQLEELYFSIAEEYDFINDGSDSEVDFQPIVEIENIVERSIPVPGVRSTAVPCHFRRRFKVKKPRSSFPDFPLLKKLAILSWFYHDLDNLGSMPRLEEIEIRMKEDVTFEVRSEPTATANTYPTVTKLKFQCTLNSYSFTEFGYDKCLSAPMLTSLITAFPNVTELNVELGGDEALRAVFRALGGQLKRLHLNRSEISDKGITGIEWTEQLKQSYKTHALSADAIVAEHRNFPFIGDLRGLQELTYKGHELTNLSIEFGLISLTELTSLKIPPHCPRPMPSPRWVPQTSCMMGRPSRQPDLVSVRPLVNHLKYLVKLDVNDDPREDKVWYPLFLAGKNEEKAEDTDGCFISEADLEYIKQNAPGLEIVYKKYSTNELEAVMYRNRNQFCF